MKRSNLMSVILGSAVLLLPLACSEGSFAPARAPLEVRVRADTIGATVNDWGPSRSASFTTVVELRNRSRYDVVEFYLCGSFVLQAREGLASYGAICPGIHVPPIVLEPGRSITIDYAHFLCLAGACLREGDTEAFEGPYEIQVNYRVAHALPHVSDSFLRRQEVARSNGFEVVALPAAGESQLLEPLLPLR